MSSELFSNLLSNIWSIFLVVLFFGGSIFVHELGHFLAARRRGVRVECFSIGFGPKIFSWNGKDGVEYRVSWLPLGGYVKLPQLADLRAIEGEASGDTEQLPPVSYSTKMLVFVAGATFNVLFALILATILWVVGQPENSPNASTKIGYIGATLDMPDGSFVPSPAAQAGLQIGDIVTAIDGTKIYNWSDLMQTLVTGAGRTSTGAPKSVFTIVRNGETKEITLYPRLSGDEELRRVGISPGYELLVAKIAPDSLAAKAGFQLNDEIITVDGKSTINIAPYQEYLELAATKPVIIEVKRGGTVIPLTLPPREDVKKAADIGIEITTGFKYIYPTPFAQITDQVKKIIQTLSSLLNPRSDIGLNKVSGPVGIVSIFHSAAEAGIRVVLMFTIMININLAIFNLLPIPVLDGGQMLFATIGKLRGKALPVNFIMSAQSIFMVLLFSMIIYVTFFDVSRIARNNRPSQTTEQDK